MLSLKELHRAARILENRLADTLLQRIVQPDEYGLALSFYGAGETRIIFLSCRPQSARVSAPSSMPRSTPAPLPFAQYLRSHLGRAVFGGVRTSSEDRHLALRLRGGEGSFEIVLSILGARSNLYLLDGQGILLFAMRPLEETRRELGTGRPWTPPAGKLRSAGEDRWAGAPDERFLEEIERTSARLDQRREFDELARRVERALGKEQSYLERKAFNLQQDLAEARKAEEYRRKGELLKGVLHEIRPGDEVVAATDYETGGKVVIDLDPRLSPAENLKSYFKRYQKELRGAGAIGEQLEEVGRSRDEIGALEERLDDLKGLDPPDMEELEALAAEPRIRKLIARYYPARRPKAAAPPITVGKREIPARLLPRRYKTAGELEIWVGRSDEGNDYLTTRLARGNDLFFHLEGYPGSHVVLRTQGKKDPPPEALLEAAELAVHFSKMKSAGRADVHVAPVKNVKKPKGAKPGLVYVGKGKTIHLRRDPKRLQGVMASRLDDQ